MSLAIMTEIIEAHGSLLKIDCAQLGDVYIICGGSPNQNYLFKQFESASHGEKNPDIHKHHFIAWCKVSDFYIVYYRSDDGKDLFINYKVDLVYLQDLLCNKMGVAYSAKYDTFRFQPADTRFYKISLPFEKLYNSIIENFLKIHSNKTKFVDSVESFDKLMGEYGFYRGHGCYRYKLLPSVMRGKWKDKEIDLYKEFIKNCGKEAEGKTDYKILAIMQHYGLPTRLLDVSIDRYVALFMACTIVFGSEKELYDIGEVFGFMDLETVTSDSKEVEQIAAYAAGKVYKNADFEKLRKSYFIEYEEDKDNERLLRQKGSFIIFGIDENPQLHYSSVYIINKQRILSELNEMGYNEMTLVPELEHICHHIKQKLE